MQSCEYTLSFHAVLVDGGFASRVLDSDRAFKISSIKGGERWGKDGRRERR